MNTANTSILTRGERNNNPGNIDKNSIIWKGIAAVSTDIRFCTFKTAAYGIRAIPFQTILFLSILPGLLLRSPLVSMFVLAVFIMMYSF